jgi:hypothetical protein
MMNWVDYMGKGSAGWLGHAVGAIQSGWFLIG